MGDVFDELRETATDQWIAGTLASLTRLKDAAVGEKRYGDAEWLERAADDLSRTRFHERQNYAHWQDAVDAVNRLCIVEWSVEDGDRRCQNCGRPNPAWFADNAVWNEVMGGEGGVLCPTCFALKAPDGIIWRLYVERTSPPANSSAEEA